MRLEGEAWREFFDAFKGSAFRLETLPVYGVASEDEEFRRFLAGEPRPDEELADSPWLRRVREFTEIFGRLFPGGDGKLVLTDPGDMLTTGIEVEDRPLGKRSSACRCFRVVRAFSGGGGLSRRHLQGPPVTLLCDG